MKTLEIVLLICFTTCHLLGTVFGMNTMLGLHPQMSKMRTIKLGSKPKSTKAEPVKPKVSKKLKITSQKKMDAAIRKAARKQNIEMSNGTPGYPSVFRRKSPEMFMVTKRFKRHLHVECRKNKMKKEEQNEKKIFVDTLDPKDLSPAVKDLSYKAWKISQYKRQQRIKNQDRLLQLVVEDMEAEKERSKPYIVHFGPRLWYVQYHSKRIHRVRLNTLHKELHAYFAMPDPEKIKPTLTLIDSITNVAFEIPREGASLSPLLKPLLWDRNHNPVAGPVSIELTSRELRVFANIMSWTWFWGDSKRERLHFEKALGSKNLKEENLYGKLEYLYKSTNTGTYDPPNMNAASERLYEILRPFSHVWEKGLTVGLHEVSEEAKLHDFRATDLVLIILVADDRLGLPLLKRAATCKLLLSFGGLKNEEKALILTKVEVVDMFIDMFYNDFDYEIFGMVAAWCEKEDQLEWLKIQSMWSKINDSLAEYWHEVYGINMSDETARKLIILATELQIQSLAVAATRYLDKETRLFSQKRLSLTSNGADLLRKQRDEMEKRARSDERNDSGPKRNFDIREMGKIRSKSDFDLQNSLFPLDNNNNYNSKPGSQKLDAVELKGRSQSVDLLAEEKPVSPEFLEDLLTLSGGSRNNEVLSEHEKQTSIGDGKIFNSKIMISDDHIDGGNIGPGRKRFSDRDGYVTLTQEAFEREIDVSDQLEFELDDDRDSPSEEISAAAKRFNQADEYQVSSDESLGFEFSDTEHEPFEYLSDSKKFIKVDSDATQKEERSLSGPFGNNHVYEVGERVMRKGEVHEVVKVDRALDPPAYEVRRLSDGVVIGTEGAKLRPAQSELKNDINILSKKTTKSGSENEEEPGVLSSALDMLSELLEVDATNRKILFRGETENIISDKSQIPALVERAATPVSHIMERAATPVSHISLSNHLTSSSHESLNAQRNLNIFWEKSTPERGHFEFGEKSILPIIERRTPSREDQELKNFYDIEKVFDRFKRKEGTSVIDLHGDYAPEIEHPDYKMSFESATIEDDSLYPPDGVSI